MNIKLSDAIKAVEEEEELPGPIPDDIWEIVGGSREKVEEALRFTVVTTKKNIKERLMEL